MDYLALGDSISIDKYTGVSDGGAVSQFARSIRPEHLQNLTEDGHTTYNVLTILDIGGVRMNPDITTLTIGGNDLLELVTYADHSVMTEQRWCEEASKVLRRTEAIILRLRKLGGQIIINTVYDPADGDDALFTQMYPLPARTGLYAYNDGIRALAQRYGLPLGDLHRLFHGHGYFATSPWITDVVEPNLEGATMIAREWQRIFR